MACLITAGRLVECKDAIGGVKRVYLMNFVEDYGFTLGTGATAFQVDDLPTTEVFQYDLRPDLSGLTVNVGADSATGTTSFEQVFVFTLQQVKLADAAQIEAMAQGQLIAYVLDNNDNVWCCGMRHGLDVTAGVVQTGATRTELTGINLTLTGREPDSFLLLDPTAGVGTAKYPFDGITTPANITITVGT
tara:strand:+ start:1895 stop:2464 length:570 start_codon:yes stop_codon:yes gene_type:complete